MKNLWQERDEDRKITLSNAESQVMYMQILRCKTSLYLNLLKENIWMTSDKRAKILKIILFKSDLVSFLGHHVQHNPQK